MSEQQLPEGVEILEVVSPEMAEILTPEALAFVADLERRFGGLRRLYGDAAYERLRGLEADAVVDLICYTPEQNQVVIDAFRGFFDDIGVWARHQGVMLAAQDRGLATCPQAAFTQFHRLIQSHLSIPDSQMVVCGMALGYEDTSAVENTLLRLSLLVEQIPEIKELDLNPVIALPPGKGCVTVDARISVVPVQ